MNIALIGYGKMGKEIEKIALERGHKISHRFTNRLSNDVFKLRKGETDLAIEFTSPESAFENVRHCVEHQIPTICGTTGWYAHLKEIKDICTAQKSAFFYASNFSVGVNIFFEISKILANLMKNQSNYKTTIHEIHHTEKKDSPSGTAITLAEQVLAQMPQLTKWVNEIQPLTTELAITSERLPNVTGTHTLSFISEIDSIDFTHTAHNRKGFALGAVLAGEFLQGKSGILTMEDLLKGV
jgi:4-hydroxy-tetrahydrodipicolinate reductase